MADINQNRLQQVSTYQKAEIAVLLNANVGIHMANKTFKDFENKTANLGDTVTFEKAYRSVTTAGLVISTSPIIQRVQSLRCCQSANTSSAYSAQQFIFNVDKYMSEIGRSRILELGTLPESDILKNFTSSVTVINPQDPLNGQLIDPASGPYRFYGDGNTPIESYGQLAQAVANFRDYGAATHDMEAIIPMTIVPAIIRSGLTEFAQNRNNKDAYTWELGPFAGFTWSESNMLPIHIAGTAGQTSTTLTLVSTNDPSGANVTQLTFSSSLGNDISAIKNGDLMVFDDGVSGQPNMRYLTFTGHIPCSQPVQFRAVGDAESIGGQVTINIYPPLVSQSGITDQNLNNSLAAGMQVSVMNSHKAGAIMSGKPLYLAMPRLNDQAPFSTVTTTDPETGVSIRHYWGAMFGQNVSSYVWDVIWGSTLIAENCMRILIPLTQ